MPELSDRDRAVLEFEERWTRNDGAKEGRIREVFDLSATRYYQLLNAIIDLPAAVEFDAVLVNRLQRRRALAVAKRDQRRA